MAVARTFAFFQPGGTSLSFSHFTHTETSLLLLVLPGHRRDFAMPFKLVGLYLFMKIRG